MKHPLLTTIAAVVLVVLGIQKQIVHYLMLPKRETSKPSNSTWMLVRM